jgi:formylglycine-generating enzyme required for sulfatase activity
MNRKIARVLFMTLEHEALHAETLLYMLIQRSGSGTLPPPGFTPPPWSSLAAIWNSAPPPKSETVILGPGTVIIGHDDAEADDIDSATAFDVAGHEFGWDNEHPKREVHVDQFMIEWRPVTNRQFYEFSLGAGKGKVQLPASWLEKNGRIEVCLLLSTGT